MKQHNKVIAGMFMAILFAAGVTYGTAFAQETDISPETDVRALLNTILIVSCYGKTRFLSIKNKQN